VNNTGPITVNISDLVNVGNVDLNVLTGDLNHSLNGNDVDVSVIEAKTISVLENSLNIHVCQVKVLELGVWNINVAKCN
jgi:hypothetical protein